MPKCVVWIFLLAKRITVHNLSALFSGKLKTLFIITGERLFWDWGEISTAKYCICIYDIVLPYYNKCLNLIFAFTYNAESFTIVFFIFLFCLLHLFWDGLVKVLCVCFVYCAQDARDQSQINFVGLMEKSLRGKYSCKRAWRIMCVRGNSKGGSKGASEILLFNH